MTTAASAYGQATTDEAEDLSAQVCLFGFTGHVQAIWFQNHLNESFDRNFFCASWGRNLLGYYFIFHMYEEEKHELEPMD